MWRLLERDNESNLRYWAVAIVVFSVALRVLFSSQIELLPEETYYWNYSRHLDIGYLDHPPMVAWLIRVGTSILGNTSFAVRSGASCCGLLASFFCYRLTRNLFGDTAAWVALVLVQTLPYFFLSGMLMTPDSPLIACWSAFLFFFERAVRGGRTLAWMWTGLSLGLGLLSKYTIVFAGLAALLYVAMTPACRYWLRRFEPYAAAIFALAIFSPVIFWNEQHDWASFAFQTVRRVAELPQFSLHKLVGSALLLIAPIGPLTLCAVAWQSPDSVVRVSDAEVWAANRRLLLYFIAVPMCFFTVFSLRHQIKVDWTGAPWTAALPLIAFAIVAWRRRASGRLRTGLVVAWPATIAVLLAIYSVGFGYLAVGLPGIGYSSHMELAPVGWRELGHQVGQITRSLEAVDGKPVLVVGMDRYETASELAFYSGNRLSAVDSTSAGHLFGGVGLMYELWYPMQRTAAACVLLVSWSVQDLSNERLRPYLDSLDPVVRGALWRNGRFIRTFYYRVGHTYRHPPTAPTNPG